VPGRRAFCGTLASCAVALGIVALSLVLPIAPRAWLPLLYLPLGYWVPAMLTPDPGASHFEAWLRAHDAAWRTRLGEVSGATAAVLELAYMACYVVVPLAFAIVWREGTAGDVDRFWVAVLLSGFACYASLPWLVSRPPRMFEEHPTSHAGLASLNVSLLRRVSHELNTFPSGHVAVAAAVALTVFPVSRAAGVFFSIAAIGIAAGAAVGRYHYGVDVIAGALVGIAAALISA
jgi:hypothetical protein